MTLGIIFDLDGVLVDTAEYHYRAWHELGAYLGFDFQRCHNERQKGVSRMESLEVLLAAGGITDLNHEQKEALAEQKNRMYLEMIAAMGESDILPGMKEFLIKVKQWGCKTALGSSSKSGGMILERTRLAGYFDVVVDGNMVTRSKPDPAIFLEAARLLGLEAAQCIVIEDAVAGIEAARAAGMYCIGIGDPDILGQADLVVSDGNRLLQAEYLHLAAQVSKRQQRRI